MEIIIGLGVLVLVYVFRQQLFGGGVNRRLKVLDREIDNIIDSAPNKREQDNLKGLSLTLRKANGSKISKKNQEWLNKRASQEKNNEKIQAKKKIERAKKRKLDTIKYFEDKYGNTLAMKLAEGKVFLDMTKDMLIDVKGKPDDTIEKVSRGKVREEYFYGAYKNRQKNTSYKFRVVLVDGKVTGWNDI